ncbi:hypothetical protein Fmac_023716 [Flemingia macrophylla]|uniref:Uncharacterized protein n=1 Tax=Flemingia macrophylla TaxID=520843 RepID=A0ABD1LMA6_9FABA
MEKGIETYQYQRKVLSYDYKTNFTLVVSVSDKNGNVTMDMWSQNKGQDTK